MSLTGPVGRSKKHDTLVTFNPWSLSVFCAEKTTVFMFFLAADVGPALGVSLPSCDFAIQNPLRVFLPVAPNVHSLLKRGLVEMLWSKVSVSVVSKNTLWP